jgi:hypothetical protein
MTRTLWYVVAAALGIAGGLALALVLHGCAAMVAEAREPAHALPVAPAADCVGASGGDHVWRGSVEYVCQQDPTTDPGGSGANGDIAHFQMHRPDGGVGDRP